MSFELYTRTVRIGGDELAPGCGYRDIVIHEVTESELQSLRAYPWFALAIGFVIGLVVGSGYMGYALHSVQ